MTETIHLDPHDPMPGSPGRHVIVLRRFDEDNPDKATIQIILTGQPEQSTHPTRSDGTPMTLDEAITAARVVARQESIPRIFVLDRLDGPREHEIMAHGGDHSVGNAKLDDTDDEDGVRGSDMRDITHPHGTEQA